MKHTIALKQNHEFRRLYSKGKSAVSPYFAVYCRKTNRPVSRLGITTGVKLGNAVKRNRARRRIGSSTAPTSTGFCRATTWWWWPAPG